MTWTYLLCGAAVISGLIGVYVAAERGRPLPEGLLLGLLLGPIGVLVEVLLPQREPPEQPRYLADRISSLSERNR